MAKNGFVSAMDGSSVLLKLVFCIPVLHVVWAAYRIVKGLDTRKIMMLVVGILFIIPGIIFAWLIDAICILIYKKPVFFA